ncbi:hypothetical protein C9374_003349 [Naegleria lovaniensis]|uniref:Fatty acid desaturase domain-containing protein n=1 Tax=Naegleria lovaniensis TaxID=51637 RepID=A0AA88GTJ3_NAELO|nr:uncharacterized protein C9374_003349 [Naegleria lovaniensis]KAG2385534.1 hypothetical protein C9374_003349 [Naegleria lovaniensis]
MSEELLTDQPLAQQKTNMLEDESSTTTAQGAESSALSIPSANKKKATLPFWNHPIMYLVNIHILVCLHAFSWWALLQTANHPLRKHIISQPLSFIQKTMTYIPDTVVPHVNQNISVILSEYFPSEETVISTSFLSSPLFGFVILPIAEIVLPFKGVQYLYENKVYDKKDIDDQTNKYKLFYRVIPLIYTVTLSALFWFSLTRVHLLTIEQFLMHSFSLAVVIAQSGAISHEMLHKRTWLEKICSRIILSYHSYLHFPLEHVYSHHKKLATYEDAATARYGETVYTFVFRSSFTGYMNAWKIDMENVKKKKGKLRWLKSEMLWSTAATIALPIIIYQFIGVAALASFIITCIVAIFLVESVNYVEHYGLMRRKRDDGTYEPVNETHSYDALFRVSSYSYFNIIFHADHHFYGQREYYKLRVYDNSPKLPYGYGTMILLSFVPPLFFSVMHPILFDFYEKRGIDYNKMLQQE